jgi:hypothetical protein
MATTCSSGGIVSLCHPLKPHHEAFTGKQATMARMNWNKAKYNRYGTDQFYRPRDNRDVLEREADRLLQMALSFNHTKRHRKPKAAKQQQAKVLDSGLRFITIKHANGDLQTIGRDCPWFAK